MFSKNGFCITCKNDQCKRPGLKTAAFSQLAKANLASPFQIGAHSPPGGPARNTTEIMGYSVRVDGWRYTCWFKFDNVAIVPITTAAGIIARELYDHRRDTLLAMPGSGETVNVVSEAAHASVVVELHAAVLPWLHPAVSKQPPKQPDCWVKLSVLVVGWGGWWVGGHCDGQLGWLNGCCCQWHCVQTILLSQSH